MIEILLRSEVHGDKITIVDEDDLKTISGRSWALSGDGKYALSGDGFYMHRLIANAKFGEEVDHVNLTKLDNRKHNLRICCRNQNEMNKNKRAKPCTSKYKGVCFDKARGLWIARVRRKHIGRFATEALAAQAYNDFAGKEYGDFFRGNKIPKHELRGY